MRNLVRSLPIVLVLLLAGCSAGASSTEGASVGDSGGFDEPAPAAGEESADGSEDADAGGDLPGAAPSVEDKQFIVEGSVSITVDAPRAAAAEVAALAERLGGHVQERVEQGSDDDEDASAYLVIRIPSTEVTGALDDLAGLGTVKETSITSTEVTAQARDLDARIRALEISVARLEDLLGRAQTSSDVVNAEQALTERQSELERLVSERNQLADKVALSTLRVELFTVEAAPIEPEDPPSGFWGGLVTGWNSLVATIGGLLLALGVLLPWAAALGLIALVVLAVRRRRRTTGRPGPAATAPSGPTAAPAGPVGGAPASAPVVPAPVAAGPVPAPVAPGPGAPGPIAAEAPTTTEPSPQPAVDVVAPAGGPSPSAEVGDAPQADVPPYTGPPSTPGAAARKAAPKARAPRKPVPPAPED